MFQTLNSNLVIFSISLQDMKGHVPKTRGSVRLKRLFSAQHPRTKNQIGITERVIRMQMRDENRFEIDDIQPCRA